MRLRLTLAAASALSLLATPVLAHEHGEPDDMPVWKEDRYAPPPPMPGAQPMMAPGEREAWLRECRQRMGARDNGVGGAVIGGVVGGLAGSRIAGRGNRTEGALAGAAIGAVAGAVIDKEEDRGRNRDACESYLDDYYAQYRPQHYQGGYPAPGYGYGYQPAYGYAPAGGACCNAQPMMMVPVMMVPSGEPKCTETVEYVTEYVPVRRPAKRVIRDKRIKLVPDKRIRTN